MTLRIQNPTPFPTEDRDPHTIARELLEAARAGDADRLRTAGGRLYHVDPRALDGDEERLAFWLNLYNALVLHAFGELRPSGSLLTKLRLFSRIAYVVGTATYTANQIEHGLLRKNRRAPLSLRATLREGDARLGAAPAALDPRVHFALNCGARSCPPVRAYAPDAVDAHLDLATRAYLGDAKLDRARREVTLPRLMKIYAADFGGPAGCVRFTGQHTDGDDGAYLIEHAARLRIRWAAYDWTIATAGYSTGPASAPSSARRTDEIGAPVP